MREDWRLHNLKADYAAIGNCLGVSEKLAKILINRNLRTYEEMVDYLHPEEMKLHEPKLLPDMTAAIELLTKTIAEKKHIRIIGDYDVDGVTSIAVLYRALYSLMDRPLPSFLDWQVPHRILDGYGLNQNIIDQAHADGVDLIITCDNGIAAAKEIQLAKDYGMQVIVTDHHEVPADGGSIGIADAVIDPKCPNSQYPYKEICGAVVAWKFMQELYDSLPGHDSAELDYLYELVALATVADVMDLRDENRAIVRRGLKKLRNTSFLGLKCLFTAYKIPAANISSGTIGFQIAPILNAGGRLETAQDAVRLLILEDEDQAMELATLLTDLNSKRKNMTELAATGARDMVIDQGMAEDKVLVLYLPDCHESIAGIVAGRVREMFYRPTFILTDGLEGIKGSGRSIEGYDMFHEMEKVKELFTKFGGHEMAAGLSLQKENIEPLRKALNDLCPLTEAQLRETVWIDLHLPPSEAELSFAKELEYLEPFGKGNATPQFAAKQVRVIRITVIGKERKGLRLSCYDENMRRFEMTYWGDMDALIEELIKRYGENAWEDIQRGNLPNVSLKVIYNLDVSEYRGEESVKIMMKKYRFEDGN